MTSASDGEQALVIAREEMPDLILPDMLLPKMAGRDVLKTLKKDPATAEIPVVALTGLSQKDAARLHENGAFALLQKSELHLDRGCEPLLAALAEIVAKLPEARAAGAK